MAQRKPFGIPGPPCRHYAEHFGCLVSDVERNEAVRRGHELAMKTCQLIADDRRAETALPPLAGLMRWAHA